MRQKHENTVLDFKYIQRKLRSQQDYTMVGQFRNFYTTTITSASDVPSVVRAIWAVSCWSRHHAEADGLTGALWEQQTCWRLPRRFHGQIAR